MHKWVINAHNQRGLPLNIVRNYCACSFQKHAIAGFLQAYACSNWIILLFLEIAARIISLIYVEQAQQDWALLKKKATHKCFARFKNRCMQFLHAYVCWISLWVLKRRLNYCSNTEQSHFKSTQTKGFVGTSPDTCRYTCSYSWRFIHLKTNETN